MVRKFASDRQRKAVMASIIGRMRTFQTGVAQRIRARRELKGRERIASEQQALKQERIQADRLRAELEVEQAREAVAKQKRETQAAFAKLEMERFERSLRGRALAIGKKAARAGLKKLKQK